MRAITRNTNRVKSLVDEVTQGSQEQVRGIEQIGMAISQMEQGDPDHRGERGGERLGG